MRKRHFIVVTIPFNRLNVTPFELNEGAGSDVPNGSQKSSVKIIEMMKENPEITIPMMAETLRLTTRVVEKNVDENALFHFDALFVSLAKHWPSLSEIPTSPAITFAHFLAISANIFAHFPPQFPTKNAIFHQISPFSQRFSDTGQNFSKKIFHTSRIFQKVGTAFA